MRYVRPFCELMQRPLSRRGLMRLCLIAGLLIGLFTHGFMFANKIPNHDDLRYGISIAGASVESGRFALYFFWKLFSNMSTPWLNGLWGTLFLSCAGFLICDVFEVRRVWQALGMMAVLVIWPGNVSIFAFMYEAHVFMLGIALAALAVWLIRYAKHGFLWAVVPLMLATGVYQVFLMLAAGLMLVLIIRQTAFRAEGEKGLSGWRLAIACAAALALGTGAYIVLAKTIPGLMGMALSDYQGMNSMGAIDLRTIPPKLLMAYDKVWETFYADIPNHTTRLSAIAQQLLLLTGAGLTLWYAGRAVRQKRFGDAVLIVLCLALLPVTGAGIYLMGDNIDTHSLTFYPLVVLLLIPLGLVPQLRLPKARQALAVGLALVCAAYGFACNVTDNQAYYKLYLAYTRGQQFANRLAVHIESAEGYEPEMTVGLYGYASGYMTRDLIFFVADETVRFVEIFCINSELDYTNFYGLPNLLHNMVGLPVSATWDWRPTTPEEQAQVDAMPIYPAQGSVQVVGDACVVKFGQSPS